jgi:hypothetical protein
MWPFKTKADANTTAPPADTWAVCQGEREGKPMFARINAAVDRSRGDPRFPTRLGIAVLLKSPSEQGLPDGIESLMLDRIEDRIAKALAKSDCGHLVLLITTGGMREFVSYVRDGDAASSVVAQAWSAAHKLQVQRIVQPDPQWAVFKQFASFV